MATTMENLGSVMSELGLDRQNGATLGRMIGAGGLGHAEENADGSMRASVHIPSDQLIFEPSVTVMPHGGDLELELTNDDKNTHCALLPSNNDRKFLWLENGARGTAHLNLDGPGYYWYSSPVGNDEGRGLNGIIAVLGDVEDDAKLDRPAQPRA